jgi:hypothetical protein
MAYTPSLGFNKKAKVVEKMTAPVVHEYLPATSTLVG